MTSPPSHKTPRLSTPNLYKKSGVDVDAGNDTVNRLAPLAQKTQESLKRHGSHLALGVGGFAAAIEIPTHFNQPVLVSATDGVGTKLELAREYGQLEVIGQDVVAMCVNDLLCAGANPLYFLDYFACGKLAPETVTQVINGIVKACLQVDCALVGGETAEMPDIYATHQFDVAGFAVGVCEKKSLLPQHTMSVGNTLIAIGSSGAHSNGYSLIRKLLKNYPDLSTHFIDGQSVIDYLLTPTRLYGPSINLLRQEVDILGLAHITGGGLIDNVSRIIAPSLTTDIVIDDIPLPPLFAHLQSVGNIPTSQLWQVFNGGIGMVAIVSSQDVNTSLKLLQQAGENVWVLGQLITKTEITQ